jgi:very-short-patch-repair endonuclease
MNLASNAISPAEVARLQAKAKREALEDHLYGDLVKVGLHPVRQFKFHPTRRWKFDFAFPDSMLAIEVDGGTWSNGRHTRGSGYQKDAEKLNAATVLGWRLLRYTAAMVKSGEAVRQIEEALG